MADRTYLPVLNRRFVILHYHIVKNAGSTVAAILEREFREAFVDLDSDCPSGLMTAPELLEYLDAQRHVVALSSHQIRFPCLQSNTIIPFEFCFVRHPLDRLESLYAFSRLKDRSTPLGELAQQTDLPGFIRELLDRFPHFACNAQVTLIANGGRFTRPPDKEDFERAASIMRKIAAPGVVHRFDECMASAEYFLRPAFPNLQLHYLIQNVSRPVDQTMPDRERRLRRALGEKAFRELRRMNELDFQLVRATEKEMDRRIALVPSFESRMKDFAARCAPLRESGTVVS